MRQQEPRSAAAAAARKPRRGSAYDAAAGPTPALINLKRPLESRALRSRPPTKSLQKSGHMEPKIS